MTGDIVIPNCITGNACDFAWDRLHLTKSSSSGGRLRIKTPVKTVVLFKILLKIYENQFTMPSALLKMARLSFSIQICNHMLFHLFSKYF